MFVAMSTTPIGLILDLSDSHSPTFIPWASASYALFGKNGVGKTRRLDAINHLFHGGTAQDSRRTFLEPSGRSTCSIIVEVDIPECSEQDDGDEFEWEDQPLGGLLADYLQLVHPGMGVLPRVGEARSLYEEHMLGELKLYGGESPQMTELLLQQRYFEISRDELDRVVVRPCYLESPDHPALGSRLSDLAAQSEAEGTSSIEWSSLATETLVTLDGGHILFGQLGLGEFLILRNGEVEGPTGYACVDLRATMEPDTSGIGEHLARLLAEGSDVEAFAQRLSEAATRQLHTALPTSSGLRLRVPSHADLLRGRRVQWLATIPSRRDLLDSATSIRWERLSAAERMWALLAIHWATASLISVSPTILLIDEPEQGLHRGAERQALTWLAELGEDPRTWLWCVTHSPVLLGDERVSPVAVREQWSSGQSIQTSSSMKLVSPQDKDELDTLGLGPTDLLASRRGFLLVEGAHDETVLTELVGSELAKLQVEIVPLRGASKLPGAIEARTLFDFTDALVLALLDAIPSDGLRDVWADARNHADDPEEALNVLMTGFAWPAGNESDWMKQWLMRSIERGRGRHSRVEPLGVSKADIIEYLPVQQFVPNAASWEDLRSEHTHRLDEARGTPKDFKSWLTRAYGADFTRDALQRASHSMDYLPRDITELLETIRGSLLDYEEQRRP